MRFLALIAAIGKNRVIGGDNDLLWHLPDDFKYFKESTKERVVIMGRNTYDSMGKALPHRYNFVLSRQDLKLEDAKLFQNPELALEEARKIDETPIIIGGEKIYQLYLKEASHLFLTRVDFEADGEAYFPEFEHLPFELLRESFHPKDEKHRHGFAFQIFQHKDFRPTEAEQFFLDQQIARLSQG
ncbi:MAG: dihydrofolate reductase [Luteibaculum sp.]